MQEEGERMTRCMMRADDRQRGSPCVLAIFAAARAVHAVRDAGKTESTRLAETRDGKPLQADDCTTMTKAPLVDFGIFGQA
jgi:hypothetical protein